MQQALYQHGEQPKNRLVAVWRALGLFMRHSQANSCCLGVCKGPKKKGAKEAKQTSKAASIPRPGSKFHSQLAEAIHELHELLRAC